MSVPVEADKVVVSENVLTMSDRDDSGPSFAAFKNGRICAVGPVSGLSSWEGSGTEIIDVGDRLVLPGFIDTHCHLEKHARTTYKSVDVRAPRCASIAHVTKELERSIPDSLLDGWIVAQGNLFFDQKLADQRLPTRDDLDRASKDVPIMIRAGGHVSILNTAALERAGFDKSYTPPDDGGHGKAELLLDEKGQPNGVIKEMDDLVPFPRASGANLKQAIRHAAGESFTRFGVTSICQLSETVEGLQLMDELIRGQDIGLRIASFITVPATMTLDDACSWQDHLEVSAPPDWFEIKGVKIFTDGGYSAASAAVKSNYLSTKRNGEMGLTKEEIRAYYVRTQQAGLGLAVHTNGDRAQEIVCEAVLMDEGPLGGVPVRLEQAGNFLPDYTTVDLWRRAGARPVPQPVFLYAFGDFFRFTWATTVPTDAFLFGVSSTTAGSCPAAPMSALGPLAVDNLNELMASAGLLAQGRPAGPGGLGAILDSGGLRQLLVDLADKVGVPLAKLSQETIEAIEEHLPHTLVADNPLDAAGPFSYDYEVVFENCLQAIMNEPDTALGWFEFDATDRFTPVLSQITTAKSIRGKSDKPFLVVNSSSATLNTQVAVDLLEAGVPVINGVEAALVAVRNLLAYRDYRERGKHIPPLLPAGAYVDVWRKRLTSGKRLSEVEALSLLNDFGIPSVSSAAASNFESLTEEAEEMGYPLALKTAAPGIDHKTDCDGVRLNLANLDELRAAYEDLDTRLGGEVTVAEMAPAGVEIGFGMIRDPQFGPLVMVSAGGALIELLKDTVTMLAPVDERDACRHIEKLGVYPLLEGARSQSRADIDALVEALVSFSGLAACLGDVIAEMDVNPVLVSEEGLLAVDALVVPGRET